MLNHTDGEEGLGLVELIVAIFVSTIVLVAMASILINSWLTQNDVLSTSEATTRGQVISSSIERAVRNALYFDTRAADTELWVHTSFDDPASNDPRTCQAFGLGGGEATLKSSPANLNAASWGTWIDDADQSWVVRVEQSGTTPIFVQSGRTLTYTFEIKTDSAPVHFQGEVTMRAPTMGAMSPC
ncbi:PilW family protein [Microbacterium ureisolvens]|uniref:PilW family protein n=1 Tax=Microbacterium ureisolvens TaxID=2781186 RepID=UPI003632DBFB